MLFGDHVDPCSVKFSADLLGIWWSRGAKTTAHSEIPDLDADGRSLKLSSQQTTRMRPQFGAIPAQLNEVQTCGWENNLTTRHKMEYFSLAPLQRSADSISIREPQLERKILPAYPPKRNTQEAKAVHWRNIVDGPAFALLFPATLWLRKRLEKFLSSPVSICSPESAMLKCPLIRKLLKALLTRSIFSGAWQMPDASFPHHHRQFHKERG